MNDHVPPIPEKRPIISKDHQAYVDAQIAQAKAFRAKEFIPEIALESLYMFGANLHLAVSRFQPVGTMRRIQDYLDGGGTVSEDWAVKRVEVMVLPMYRLWEEEVSRDLFGAQYEKRSENLMLKRLDELGYPIIRKTDRVIDLYIPTAGEWERLPCRVYIPRPDEWYVALVRMTGPAAFVRRFDPSPHEDNGLLVDGYSLQGNYLYRGTERVKVESEEQFFNEALGMDWVNPSERAFIGVDDDPPI